MFTTVHSGKGWKLSDLARFALDEARRVDVHTAAWVLSEWMGLVWLGGHLFVVHEGAVAHAASYIEPEIAICIFKVDAVCEVFHDVTASSGGS